MPYHNRIVLKSVKTTVKDLHTHTHTNPHENYNNKMTNSFLQDLLLFSIFLFRHQCSLLVCAFDDYLRKLNKSLLLSKSRVHQFINNIESTTLLLLSFTELVITLNHNPNVLDINKCINYSLFTQQYVFSWPVFFSLGFQSIVVMEL